MRPVPEPAPIVLALHVTLPLVIFTAHQIPFVVAAPLEVASENALMRLSVTFVVLAVPTARSIAMKRVATVPAMVYVPVFDAEA